MIKALVYESQQRAGGWCESAGDLAYPLFELSMMNRGVVSLIVRLSGRLFKAGNLGGNADSFRPIMFVWARRVFYFLRRYLNQNIK